MAYAVSADLIAYVSGLTALPVVAEQSRLLQRASDLVDAYLVGCVYNVDVNNNPTDASVIQALKDATTAQVEWWLAEGDELSELGQYMITIVEGVTLNRGPHKQLRLAPRALDALRVAGLSPSLTPIHLP